MFYDLFTVNTIICVSKTPNKTPPPSVFVCLKTNAKPPAASLFSLVFRRFGPMTWLGTRTSPSTWAPRSSEKRKAKRERPRVSLGVGFFCLQWRHMFFFYVFVLVFFFGGVLVWRSVYSEPPYVLALRFFCGGGGASGRRATKKSQWQQKNTWKKWVLEMKERLCIALPLTFCLVCIAGGSEVWCAWLCDSEAIRKAAFSPTPKAFSSLGLSGMKTCCDLLVLLEIMINYKPIVILVLTNSVPYMFVLSHLRGPTGLSNCTRRYDDQIDPSATLASQALRICRSAWRGPVCPSGRPPWR